MDAHAPAYPAATEPEADRSILIERTLNAPPELVFEAFTTAEHLAHWWGPTGFSVTTHSFEFREGGVWRFIMHGPDGRDYPNRQTFIVIDRPSRIIARHGGDEGEPVHHETRITLEPHGDQTRITWHLVFGSVAERDHVAREFGAVEGGQQTVGRLSAYVVELAGR
jgi:uncharacterized protein YndB with AHSA1/START domain